MFPGASPSSLAKTTSYKVVLPFYAYAALSFLLATICLFFSTSAFTEHYFHPHILAITHLMTLGWGTMIILGASHQLVPVIIEGALYSNRLAMATFLLPALGIPLLVYGFHVFNLTFVAWGGSFIVLAVVLYIINLAASMAKSQHENVQAVFILTAALWLLATTVLGLVLVFNFTHSLMPRGSTDYLSLHAHMGIAGWFLLLVTGVGSRLIPMFLISKYNNTKKLWWVYGLINSGLLLFVVLFLYAPTQKLWVAPAMLLIAGIALFGNYCYQAYKLRIRKKVDEQMKVSLLSILLLALPILFVFILLFIFFISSSPFTPLATAYGFSIFFGWITAIILGMTFKTLPFIVWNKVYHKMAGKGKTPSPKDLFNDKVFSWMSGSYLAGFLLFTIGILIQQILAMTIGATLLLVCAVLYAWNVLLLIKHKPLA